MTWHICEHCLDPIAAGLERIVSLWNRIGVAPPAAEDIDALYRRFNLDRAIQWLKFHLAVEYAKDLEDRLVGTLRRFQELSFRAGQLLEGDTKGTLKEVPWRRNAIREYLDERYTWLNATGRRRDDLKDPVFVEVEEAYSELENEFRETARYLRNTAAMIRGRLERRSKEAATADQYDAPPDALLAELTGTEQRIVNYLWTRPRVERSAFVKAIWQGKNNSPDAERKAVRGLQTKLYKLRSKPKLRQYSDIKVSCCHGFVTFDKPEK